ncbi:MAG: RNA-binding protein [Ignavibacteriae bacterium]|nr:RNA-binding protein [Ignavibacteriota bacterium]
MNIFVGNLDFDVTEENLNKEFSKYGKVASVKLIKDLFTQKSKGFGFVEMNDNSEAKIAIKELNTAKILTKNIVVNEARPEKNKRKFTNR